MFKSLSSDPYALAGWVGVFGILVLWLIATLLAVSGGLCLLR